MQSYVHIVHERHTYRLFLYAMMCHVISNTQQLDMMCIKQRDIVRTVVYLDMTCNNVCLTSVPDCLAYRRLFQVQDYYHCHRIVQLVSQPPLLLAGRTLSHLVESTIIYDVYVFTLGAHAQRRLTEFCLSFTAYSCTKLNYAHRDR